MELTSLKPASDGPGRASRRAQEVFFLPTAKPNATDQASGRQPCGYGPVFSPWRNGKNIPAVEAAVDEARAIPINQPACSAQPDLFLFSCWPPQRSVSPVAAPRTTTCIRRGAAGLFPISRGQRPAVCRSMRVPCPRVIRLRASRCRPRVFRGLHRRSRLRPSQASSQHHPHHYRGLRLLKRLPRPRPQ